MNVIDPECSLLRSDRRQKWLKVELWRRLEKIPKDKDETLNHHLDAFNTN